MPNNLYSKKIFRHSNNPRNKGMLENATYTFVAENPSCGDDLILYVQCDAKDVITEVKWQGSGCALSQAAASIFTDMIMNKKIDEVKQFSNEVLLDQLDVELSPARLKCGLLPLYCVKEIEE